MAASKPRVAIGGIIHETHVFAEPQTTLANYREQGLYAGDDLLAVLSGHAGAIAVTALANEARGLVGPLHGVAPKVGLNRAAVDRGAGQGCQPS